jgi:hypothetical protein
MTQRTKVAAQLAAYFDNKGHILSASEYRKQKDAPIRFALVNSIFGGWNRMEKVVRTFNGRNQKGEDYVPATDVDEVIRRASQADAEYAEKMRAASENLEAKTAREEAARQYIEADKLRAASAEGAYENKMRKGGVTSQDAKAAKEAIEHAVAEEHAMLVKTPEGAALGKYMLGGVEDNDEKTRVIAEQNAFREKKALLAATPEGSAEASLMEDDTDGQLSREAQARIRNELRTYVPPVTDGNVEKAQTDAIKKVRDEVRDTIVKAGSQDENTMTGSAVKASLARNGVNDIVTAQDVPEDVLQTMTPADQPVADDYIKTLFKDADGNVVAEVEDTEDAPAPGSLSNTTASTGEGNQNANQNLTDDQKGTSEMTSEADQNEKNPAATPADRNPDPELGTPGSGDEKQNNEDKPEIVFPAKK